MNESEIEAKLAELSSMCIECGVRRYFNSDFLSESEWQIDFKGQTSDGVNIEFSVSSQSLGVATTEALELAARYFAK